MSLISTFWNGDIRLAHSYWLWFVSGNLAWIGASDLWPALYETTLVSFLEVTWTIFVLVGLWRSAGKYEGRFWGVSSWGAAVRGLIGLGIVAGILGLLLVSAVELWSL